MLLLHVPVPPEAVASASGIVNPVHTEDGPVIAPALGDALTVILVVVITVPQLTLVSVNVIVVTPALTPYTTPVVEPTVPTAVLLLLHVPVPPDAVASARGIVNPVHTDEGPVIVPATGDAITVIFVVVVAEPQETVVSVKVIIVVPALTPYKIPVTGSMVPTAVLLLLHVPVPPDAEASLNVMLVPVHTNEEPDIAPALGDVTTVTFIVAVAVPQEAVVSVKVIVVMPGPTPYTTPVVDPTVPTAVLLLLHVPVPPDAVASLSVILEPVHIEVTPLIVPALGEVFTVTFVVAVSDPQLAVVSVNVIVVVPPLTP